jgi:CheY-like chemotaxis protein
VNPAFERLTEYPSLEIVGKDLSSITEGEAQSKSYQAIWQRVFEQKQFIGMLNLRTKSGDVQTLGMTISPIYGSRGRIISLVGTGHIVPSPRHEPKKRSPDAGLTRMLHDFKNILLVVVAHAELAMDTLPLDHPARCHVESSKSAAQSAAALLHEFTCAGPSWTGVPRVNSNRHQPEEPRPPVCASQPRAQPATILLVEDESLILNSNVEFLKAAGYNVLSAGTGGEALDLIQGYRGDVDLLITDMVLPQISGSELAIAIASSHPEALVLAISGHPEEYVLRQPAIGYYLPKPYSLTELHDKIRFILDEKKTASGVDAAG